MTAPAADRQAPVESSDICGKPAFRVRRIRSSDRAAVLQMHARCSRETRYFRWLAPSTYFPDSYLRSVLACEAEHMAVVAVIGRGSTEVVGLASAARTSDGHRELGFLVEDRFQVQGVGNAMLELLIAHLDPTETLCAYALIENRWLLSKLARLGRYRIEHDSGLGYALVDRC